MSIVAGSSNNVYAIDNDTGYVVWRVSSRRRFRRRPPQCPGGMTAGATRIVPLEPAPITFALTALPAPAGRAGAVVSQRHRRARRGRAARRTRRRPRSCTCSTAGSRCARQHQVQRRGSATARSAAPGAAPGCGTRRCAGARQAPQRAGGGGGGGGGRGPATSIPGATAEQVGGGGGLGRPSGVVYAISSDGVLHVMGLQSGKDLQRPAEFIPANARWTDTIAVDTTLYATTTGNCGNAPNAIWGDRSRERGQAGRVVEDATAARSSAASPSARTARCSPRSVPAPRPATARRTPSSRSIRRRCS